MKKWLKVLKIVNIKVMFLLTQITTIIQIKITTKVTQSFKKYSKNVTEKTKPA